MAKLNYRIKLLAGRNVILVESDGCESEMFTPQLINGRITLLNIIPNRRCCQVQKNNSSKESQEKLKDFKEHNVDQRNQFHAICAPLANSTPTGSKQAHSNNGTLCKYQSLIRSIDSTLASPELVRRAMNPHLLEKSMLNLPNGEMLSRIHTNTKTVERLVTASPNASGMHKSANVSLLNSSYMLPSSSVLSRSSISISTVNSLFSTGADSIARWEKVLTPVRTYSKKFRNSEARRRRVTEDIDKHSKFAPTYLVNPTQTPKVTQLQLMKRSKLIIDNKICISPKTFKKQQKMPVEMHKKLSTILQTNSLIHHKPRSNMQSTIMSAFDLLTNSNRINCMAKVLNQQFRKGCINKASSTYHKYKILSMVPPLQDEEHVVEFTRISLESSQSSLRLLS